MSIVRSCAFKAAAAFLAFCSSAPYADAAELASAWSQGKRESKARLVAGSVSGKPIAAVEIALADGWKTYWRTPGDAGGVPPLFNWAKSDNVENATVLYPAPTRFSDKDGETLGFKGSVVFPVVVRPKDATKPVRLVLVLDYGICRDVCIPVETELKVDIPAGEAGLPPPIVMAALERVPRAVDALRPQDPILIRAESKLDGPNPVLAIEAEFPGGTANAAVYVESVDGDYIPLPKVGSAKIIGPNKLRFEIDLTSTGDATQIRGKDGKVTLVSGFGLSEAMFKFE